MILLYFVILLFVLFLAVIFYFFNLAFVRKNNTDIENLDSKHNDFLAPYIDILKNGMEFIKNCKNAVVSHIDENSEDFAEFNRNNALLLAFGSALNYLENAQKTKPMIKSSVLQLFACFRFSTMLKFVVIFFLTLMMGVMRLQMRLIFVGLQNM